MTSAERPGPSEIEKTFPGLEGAVGKASEITTKNFGKYRQDIEETRPPLVLYAEADFKQLTKGQPALSTSRAIVQYNPGNGAIYGNADGIRSLLKKGDEGKLQITRMITEGYIHTIATTTDENGTRVGYTRLPITQQPHTLKPGEIYSSEPLKEGKTISGKKVASSKANERLTKHVTELLLHHMLSNLRPDTQGKYPQILIEKIFSQYTVTKNEKNFDLLTKSLFTGDRELLAGVNDLGNDFVTSLDNRIRITSVPPYPMTGGQRFPL